MQSARAQLVGGISALFAFLVFGTATPSAQTVPISPWLVDASPTVEKISEVDLSQPLQESIIGNRDCQDREVVIRPKRLASPPQSKMSHQACVVDTGFGAYSTTSQLQRSGSMVYGELRSGSGGSAAFMPIPRSSTGIRLSGGVGFGTYAFFYDNLEQSIESTAIYDGTVIHKLPTTYSTMLKDRAGNLLAVDPGSMSFSADGNWMITDLPFVGTARVDVRTREVLPFGDAPNYAVGLSVNFKTAISPDGRYAVVASRNFEIFRMYDLSTCGPVPNVIAKKVACSSRDLLPFIRQQIPGFTSVASMRLRSNYTLELYANSVVNNVTRLTRYQVVADGQKAPGFQYLALGDSFASGEGAYQYKSYTDTSQNKCHLSQRSYPYLISSALGYGQSESVACSGATTEDITTEDENYTGQVKDGRVLKDRNVDLLLTASTVGYLAQKSFVNNKRPDAITISIGGNDIGFSDKIVRCLDTDTCYDSYEDRLEIVQEVNSQFDRLVSTYAEVRAAADPRAKIYVIGYPQIAKPDGVCDINVRLNAKELEFAEQLISYLNSVIKRASDKAGVYYVDVESALSGHRMCEPTWSWEVAVNGLTAGNDQVNLPFVHGPIGNESYHPNALGHGLLKTKILEKTANFTAPMPNPNTNLKPDEPDPTSPLLQAPKSNRVVRNIKRYTGTDGGVIQAGTYWGWEMTRLGDAFKLGSTVEAWLHSTPTNLGTYTIGTNGSINISADIPANITPGWHTLHLYGQSSSGETVDVYKTVFVETGSPCLVALSAQDADKDGIDDACDGFISEPPLVITPPKPTPEVEVETPDEVTRFSENTEKDAETESILSTSSVGTPSTETTQSPQSTQTTPTIVATAVPSTTASPERPAVLGASTTREVTPETLASAAPKHPTQTNLQAYWPVALLILFLLMTTFLLVF